MTEDLRISMIQSHIIWEDREERTWVITANCCAVLVEEPI